MNRPLQKPPINPLEVLYGVGKKAKEEDLLLLLPHQEKTVGLQNWMEASSISLWMKKNLL